MVRRKGELTRKAIDRDWPHQVALVTPIPHRSAVADFCREAGVSLCQHTTGDGPQQVLDRWLQAMK